MKARPFHININIRKQVDCISFSKIAVVNFTLGPMTSSDLRFWQDYHTRYEISFWNPILKSNRETVVTITREGIILPCRSILSLHVSLLSEHPFFSSRRACISSPDSRKTSRHGRSRLFWLGFISLSSEPKVCCVSKAGSYMLIRWVNGDINN